MWKRCLQPVMKIFLGSKGLGGQQLKGSGTWSRKLLPTTNPNPHACQSTGTLALTKQERIEILLEAARHSLVGQSFLLCRNVQITSECRVEKKWTAVEGNRVLLKNCTRYFHTKGLSFSVPDRDDLEPAQLVLGHGRALFEIQNPGLGFGLVV